MFRSLAPNLRGMLAMTAAAVLFTFSDALAKFASQHWPVAQVLFIRSVAAIVMMVVVISASGQWRKMPLLAGPVVSLRSGIEAALALVFVSALSMMPLADLTTIVMLSPLVITAIANLFLGEQVGWRRWSAILVGFLGLLLVVQPGGPASQAPNYLFGTALGLVCVFMVAARDILTQRIGPEVPSAVISLGTLLATLAGSALLSIVSPWKTFAWLPLIYVVLAAVIVTIGNVFVIVACRDADLSVVAPYRYSAVIWAIAVGYFAFGAVPNALSLTGMGVIMASGVYLMHRERVRRREAEAARKAAGQRDELS